MHEHSRQETDSSSQDARRPARGGGLRILAEGYPLCDERFDGEERFLVCVNPSAESRPIVGAYSEIVYAEHFDEKSRIERGRNPDSKTDISITIRRY